MIRHSTHLHKRKTLSSSPTDSGAGARPCLHLQSEQCLPFYIYILAQIKRNERAEGSSVCWGFDVFSLPIRGKKRTKEAATCHIQKFFWPQWLRWRAWCGELLYYVDRELWKQSFCHMEFSILVMAVTVPPRDDSPRVKQDEVTAQETGFALRILFLVRWNKQKVQVPQHTAQCQSSVQATLPGTRTIKEGGFHTLSGTFSPDWGYTEQ